MTGRRSTASLPSPTGRFLDRARALRGLFLRAAPPASPFSTGYLPARETVAAARRAGLSVCDHVERMWGQEGDTQAVVDRMAGFGAFGTVPPRVLEIGPGTGRYLERILARGPAASYEIYETAPDWAEWLAQTYPVIRRRADGSSLADTADGSVDLVHAHGVFVLLPLLVSCRYFRETARVLRPGGFAVFDVISESCLDGDMREAWLRSEHAYPALLTVPVVAGCLGGPAFERLGGFFTRYGPGRSEYLVFRKADGGEGTERSGR